MELWYGIFQQSPAGTADSAPLDCYHGMGTAARAEYEVYAIYQSLWIVRSRECLLRIGRVGARAVVAEKLTAVGEVLHAMPPAEHTILGAYIFGRLITLTRSDALNHALNGDRVREIPVAIEGPVLATVVRGHVF
jgi:hypothetical protein